MRQNHCDLLWLLAAVSTDASGPHGPAGYEHHTHDEERRLEPSQFPVVLHSAPQLLKYFGADCSQAINKWLRMGTTLWRRSGLSILGEEGRIRPDEADRTTARSAALHGDMRTFFSEKNQNKADEIAAPSFTRSDSTTPASCG